LAFESQPGVKIKSADTKQIFIIADYFSVYEKGEENPNIYEWSKFASVAETKDAFTLNTGTKTYRIPKKIIPDPAVQLRVRAIIEGVVAAYPHIEYTYGMRILPPKFLCVGCEIPPDAYVAVGSYKEKEVNNSNVVLLSAGLDKAVLFVFPIVALAVFTVLWFVWGKDAIGTTKGLNNLIKFIPISLFAGAGAAMTVYLVCAFAAKTLYSRILREDPALLEEITFVVCEEGFIAAESEVFDFSDIIRWSETAFFIETNHAYIVFKNRKAVFWLPKRLFPKDIHKELSDFIADKLQQK